MSKYRTVIASFALVFLVGITACGDSRTEEQRMTDATAAFESGKYRAALIELKNLLQENPKSIDARILLARASLQVGDVESASKELDRAGRLGASPEEIYALQQRTLSRLGKHQEVVDNYAVGKSTNPEEQAEMQLIYAKALSGLSKTAEANAQFQALAGSSASPQWRAEGLVGLAIAARAATELDKAEEFARQAVYVYPDSVSAHITLGQLAIAGKAFDDAYTHFTDGLKAPVITEEQRFVLLSGELDAALGKGDVEASKDAANRLFALAPEHPITTYMLARVAYASGDKEMSHEQVQKTLSRFPQFVPAQFLQGALSLERGEYPQAEMFLSNVVAAEPANFEARKLLAQANVELGLAPEAAKILREGIRLGPGRDELSSLLAQVNLRFDSGSENTVLLEKVLEQNPDDEKTRLALIASYVAAGQAAKAQELIESGGGLGISPERKAIVKLIAAMQSNEREAAVAQADNIIATWPDNPRTHFMIGSWFYSQGMKVKARTTVENSYAKNPDSGELAGSLSRMDLSEGKQADAVARLEEFLKRQPQNSKVWLMLTAIYVTNRDGEKALEILEQARKTIPDDYKLKIATVRILLAESRTDDAVQMAGQMAAEHATIDVVQQVYGVALFEDKQYDLALEFLKKANSMQPRQPETLTYKGRAEARLNQLAQAKKTFETLWEVSPGNLEAAQSIATIELRGNDTAAANKILKELRVLRPNDPRVDGIEADIRELRGDYKGAFELYQKVYEHNKNRETVMKLVNLAPRMGADGIQIVKDFLQENPDDEPARVLLAQLLQQKGRSSEAITEYETILAARPKDTLVLNNLAWLYFETSASGSGERALELSKLAHELNPGSAPIADTHGWILFRSGNVEKGKEVLALADQWAQEQGISVARDIAYHYAAALSESGDRAAARVRLNSILSDDTPFSSREEAQRLLDSLAAR